MDSSAVGPGRSRFQAERDIIPGACEAQVQGLGVDQAAGVVSGAKDHPVKLRSH